MLARSAMGVRGGDLLRRPTEAALAPPGMRRGWRYAACPFWHGRGRLGLLAPDPRQRAAWPSGLPFGGMQLGLEARRAEGAPRLWGSRLATGEARRGCAGLPLSVTATAVTPSPPGKGASPRLARSVMGAGGGDLLRGPTEAAQAPSAMPGTPSCSLSALPVQTRRRWHKAFHLICNGQSSPFFCPSFPKLFTEYAQKPLTASVRYIKLSTGQVVKFP